MGDDATGVLRCLPIDVGGDHRIFAFSDRDAFKSYSVELMCEGSGESDQDLYMARGHFSSLV